MHRLVAGLTELAECFPLVSSNSPAMPQCKTCAYQSSPIHTLSLSLTPVDAAGDATSVCRLTEIPGCFRQISLFPSPYASF